MGTPNSIADPHWHSGSRGRAAVKYKANEFARRLRRHKWAACRVGPLRKFAKSRDARYSRKTIETGRQARRVDIEFAPQMQAAIPGVVCFEHKPCARSRAQSRRSPDNFRECAASDRAGARNPVFSTPNCFTSAESAVSTSGKVKVVAMNCGENGAAELTGAGSIKIVGIKEKLLRAEREIVDGAQQRAVVKDARAQPNHGLAGLERIVGNGKARPKVIVIAHDAFVFPTQAESSPSDSVAGAIRPAQRNRCKCFFASTRFESFAENGWPVGQKITGTGEGKRAGDIRQIDEGRAECVARHRQT